LLMDATGEDLSVSAYISGLERKVDDLTA
jgi:hypothetical protein